MSRSKKRIFTKVEQVRGSLESSLGSELSNSFLSEVTHNNDIDSSIRREIERKFKKSVVNPQYRFPRAPENPRTTWKVAAVHASRKKLRSEKSLPVIHHRISSGTAASRKVLRPHSLSRVPSGIPHKLRTKTRSHTPGFSLREKSSGRSAAKNVRIVGKRKQLENPYRLPVQLTQKFHPSSNSFEALLNKSAK